MAFAGNNKETNRQAYLSSNARASIRVRIVNDETATNSALTLRPFRVWAETPELEKLA